MKVSLVGEKRLSSVSVFSVSSICETSRKCYAINIGCLDLELRKGAHNTCKFENHHEVLTEAIRRRVRRAGKALGKPDI